MGTRSPYIEDMVLVTGLEPVRVLSRRILSPLRLPIPPHERPFFRCLAIVAFTLPLVKLKLLDTAIRFHVRDPPYDT